jgi:enoyl-CoA hydratase
MAGDELLVESDGGIRLLTLNRPETRNALTTSLVERLAAELRAAEADHNVAVVILTGTDPAFCSGIDLGELTRGSFDVSVLVDPRRSPWKLLRGMETPVIGALNGPAVIAGLELALHCSFLVASERASFGDTYASVLGSQPGGGLTALLPQAIGVRRAREMSFTGQFMRAPEAYERGLVNHVVPHDQLLPFTRSLAEEIASNDGSMVRLLNQLYRQTTSGTIADALALEEKGYRSREMDLKKVLQRFRAKIWSAPLSTTRVDRDPDPE